MSSATLHQLACRAQDKLSEEAARPDLDLRRAIAHANLLDILRLELSCVEPDEEDWLQYSISIATKSNDNATENGSEDYLKSSSDSSSDTSSELSSDADPECPENNDVEVAKEISSLSARERQTVWLRDAATGQCLHTLEGHSGEVESVVFSLDAQHVASASRDRNVSLWDAATGQCL
jgi:WD40 repeat protein